MSIATCAAAGSLKHNTRYALLISGTFLTTRTAYVTAAPQGRVKSAQNKRSRRGQARDVNGDVPEGGRGGAAAGAVE